MFKVQIGTEEFYVNADALAALAAIGGASHPWATARVARHMPIGYHVNWFVQPEMALQRVTITKVP